MQCHCLWKLSVVDDKGKINFPTLSFLEVILMSQQANVTLNTVVYAPNGTSNGVATWANRSSGYGSGFTFLTEKLTQNNSTKTVRSEFKLTVPVVETVGTAHDAVGTLLRTSTCFITCLQSTDSTAAERTDFKLRIQNLVASTPFTDAVGNLDPAYG